MSITLSEIAEAKAAIARLVAKGTITVSIPEAKPSTAKKSDRAERYKAEGRCACGRMPEDGYKRCLICRERSSHCRKRVEDALLSKGLCIDCKVRPPTRGITVTSTRRPVRCSECREAARKIKVCKYREATS